jgi:hypothetical protein
MAHPSSWRSCLAGDKAYNWLWKFFLDVFCSFFLCGSSDLPDQDDCLCILVFFEEFQKIYELETSFVT